jgi:hypothetical protein
VCEWAVVWIGAVLQIRSLDPEESVEEGMRFFLMGEGMGKRESCYVLLLAPLCYNGLSLGSDASLFERDVRRNSWLQQPVNRGADRLRQTHKLQG